MSFGRIVSSSGYLTAIFPQNMKLFPAGLHDLEHFLQVLEINVSQTLLGGKILCLSQPKFKRFVRANVKKRSGEVWNYLAINLTDEIIRLGIGWSQHVSVRHFGQIGYRPHTSAIDADVQKPAVRAEA